MSIKNVFPEIASFEGLLQANHDIQLGRRYGVEELHYWHDLEGYTHRISDMLYAGEYPPDTYRTFYVYEPKLRKIVSSDYITKLIQRSAYNALNPRLCKTFIEDTYACIPGRGNLKAALRLQDWINYCADSGRRWYYYKTDVRKFFYQIDHEKLMELLEKKISDRRTLALLRHYVCNASMPFGLPLGVDNPMTVPDEEMLWDVGITIGGGLSHMEGNVYLDPIDQLAKRKLKIPFYTRGMDDIIFLGDDKSQMHEQFDEIEEFANDELKLEFNEKTALRPIGIGVEYLGYIIRPHHMTIRKSTSLRMKRRLKKTMEDYNDYSIDFAKADATVQSYSAMMKWCDCTDLQKSIFDNFVLTHNSEPGGIDAERQESAGTY
ncbi:MULTISPECIES: reverse transcriptase domain-containing protein [unclassified Bilifractor]|uniref:reverse transcriptase domain-containing protein n=1 Tax=unclassified Bilifractor TaxID=2815795 RepID=UPI003F903F9B